MPKNAFEASQAVFRSLSSQKESKLSKTLFTSRELDKLSFLKPNYSFRSSGMRRKQNFRERFVAPSSFTFCFLSSPLVLLFSRFFPFVRHLLAFLSVGKGFAKSSRIVDFFEGSMSGKWDKIFIGIFWSKLHGFLRLSLVCFSESRSSGYGLNDLIYLHKLVVKVG